MNRTWLEAVQLLGLDFEFGIVLMLFALHAAEQFMHRRLEEAQARRAEERSAREGSAARPWWGLLHHRWTRVEAS
jgi:hypothetical protein